MTSLVQLSLAPEFRRGHGALAAGVSLTSYEFTTNAWVGVALVLSLLIGFLNGWIVVKTGIPSFLVTQGTFFMLQGLNLALSQTIITRCPARTSPRDRKCRSARLQRTVSKGLIQYR